MDEWMMGRILCGIIGFSGGFLVAGGVVALIVGLGIVTRFIGISHTAKKVCLYENAVLAGGVLGNLVTVYRPELGFGRYGLIALLLIGSFCGIFVGGWILALAELIHVFPVFIRRLELTKGLSWIVIFLAAGKITGSLLQFYMKWGKS
ncbi:MAG: stage V sporulation protein AB [Lachnospiraceae bacterium]|nr:stage V sporulation protein AB [Lachnospiraceae bacterium]